MVGARKAFWKIYRPVSKKLVIKSEEMYDFFDTRYALWDDGNCDDCVMFIPTVLNKSNKRIYRRKRCTSKYSFDMFNSLGNSNSVNYVSVVLLNKFGIKKILNNF